MAVKDKVKVTPLISPTVAEVLGVNDKVQLAELEALHRAERARELMVAGATLADPARIDVRGEVSLGRDVFLDANVLLEGKVTLGDRVRVGPNVVLRDVTIGADSVDPSEFRARAERARRRLPHRAVCARAPGLEARRRRAHRQLRGAQEDRRSPTAARPITSRISATPSSARA